MFLFFLLLQALTINADPLYIMLPAAIASSFAFMLPVATPPNAVIFSYGYIRVIDMVRHIVVNHLDLLERDQIEVKGPRGTWQLLMQ